VTRQFRQDPGGISPGEAFYLPGAFATTLLLCAMDVYGRPDKQGRPGILGDTSTPPWSAETIRLEIQDDFGREFPPANLAKLMASIAVLTSDRFRTSAPDFVILVNALNGVVPDDEFDPADAAECEWALLEAGLLDPPEGEEPYSDDVRGYIGLALDYEGIRNPPDQLKIGTRDSGRAVAASAEFADDPTMFASVDELQRGKSEAILADAREKLVALADQLSRLELTTGDVRGFATALKAKIDASASGLTRTLQTGMGPPLSQPTAENDYSKSLYELFQTNFQVVFTDCREPARLIKATAKFAAIHRTPVIYWDPSQGFYTPPDGEEVAPGVAHFTEMAVKLTGLEPALRAIADEDLQVDLPRAVFVLFNAHSQLADPRVRSLLEHTAADLRFSAPGRHQRMVLLASPVASLHPELAHVAYPLRLSRPSPAEIASAIVDPLIAGLDPAGYPGFREPGVDARIATTLRGLYYQQADDGLLLMTRRHRAPTEAFFTDLSNYKAGIVNATGHLTLHQGGAAFADLGGLTALKEFCKSSIAGDVTGIAPKGVLLLGPPGVGKSAFAKALGNETGRPTLILDPGKLMGKFIGDTEANLAAALATIEAMSPCILMIDEVEKALGGSAGAGDSGVLSRMLGTLLSWMSDRTSHVYVVFTSNNMAGLPPELTRAGRFDGVFFIDLPGAADRAKIWPIHEATYGVSGERPDDAGWTGAEIEGCCRQARLRSITLAKAARQIVPLSKTAAESIEATRIWAEGRCLSADFDGLYGREERPTPAPKAAPRARTASNRDASTN